MNEKDIEKSNEMDKVQEIPAEEIIEQQEGEAEETPDVSEATPEMEIIEEEPQVTEPSVKKKKPMKTGAVVAITAAATVAVCAIALFVGAKFFYNPYNVNCKYMPTIEDYAEYNSLSVDEFKESYHLPADMPDNTYISVAEYYLPVSYIAQSQGVEVDAYISSLGMSEDYTAGITETTTLGELNDIMEKYTAENSSATTGN